MANQTIQTISFGEGDSGLGGAPKLAAGQARPECRHCSEPMTFFLQLEVRPEFGLPFQPGSRLLVFMCLKHDDPPMPPLLPALSGQLPENYGAGLPDQQEHSQYAFFLNPPGAHSAAAGDGGVMPKVMQFTPAEEDASDERGSQGWKVGGVPSWAQDPESYTCSCGAPMAFLLQIPEYANFSKQPDAPPQKSTYGDSHYDLFLGNEIYVFACSAQCRPDSVWPVCQS